MEYAIKILNDEHRLLSMAINDTKAWENHPEAYKDRMKKLCEIRKALNLIDNSKGNGTDRQVGNYEPS